MSGRRRELAILAGIALLALAVRLLYLAEARAVPLFHHLISDGRAYVAWADAIVAGDFLSRGQGVFYQAPLYPYLLALVRALFGDSLWAIRLVQALAGSAACVLLAVAGRWWLSRAAGLLAGVLLALYPPAIFFDGVINKASPAVLATCALLALLGRQRRRPHQGLAAASGVVLGLLVLLRENALLLVPAVALWLVLDGGPRAGRWRRLLAFAAGLALALGPVAARNAALGGGLAVTTSQGGPNFYIGNNPAADGTYAPLRRGRSDTPFERRDAQLLAERALGRPLSPRQVSRYWRQRGFAFIAEQPFAWLRLMARKALLVGHRYELPDAEDIALYADASRLLGTLGAVGHFGVLLPLAAAGMALAWPRRRALWLLYLALLLLAAGVAAFFVFARYRMPMVPILLLFAAAALVEGAGALRRRRLRPLAAALALAVPAALLANWPLALGQASNRAMAHTNVGVALAAGGAYQEAAAAYRRALAVDPSLLEAHLNLGSTLRYLGDEAGGLEHLRAAHRLAADDPDVCHQLGQALLQGGDPAAAEPLLRRALAERPAFPAAGLDLATLLLRSGRWPQAIATLRAGLGHSPGHPALSVQLAAALVAAPGRRQADVAEAVRLAEAACAATAYRDAGALRVAAAVYSAAGRPEAVVALAERALAAAEAAGDAALAAELRGVLRAYRR